MAWTCGTTGEHSRRMLKKARLLTRPTLAVISPARPESAKTDSSPWDAPCPKQGRSERLQMLLPSLLVYVVLWMARMSPPLRASSQSPISFSRVAWLILDCARRTSTFLSCAFREQEDDQATLPILLRPRVARAQGTHRAIPSPAGGLFQHPASSVLSLSIRAHSRYDAAMSAKVMTRDQLVPLLQAAQTQGKRIVFTNGCFDLMHVGHTRYLQAAKDLGDLLVVAVNSDASVRSLNKAPDRPIVSEAQRAEVVAALGCVDYVILFNEPDPQSLIAALQPDVLVKGGDWAVERIVGREIVEARGGVIRTIPLVPGVSTTSLIQRIRSTTT